MNYREFYVNLMEAFGDDQKKKWLTNNPTLTSDQIDIYIKWFDELRKSKPAAARTINIDGVPKGEDRFDISKYSDWHSFESFIDAVRAQTQLKGEKLSDNLEVIDGKPLFEKNGLEVYYADTPRACIKYKGSVPYSWCVARADSSNMFYNYRLRGNNPAFYFVKDVEATKKELSSDKKFSGKFSNPWHFFVIQVLKTANINDLTDKSYVVTNANNDGDVPMSWNEIVKIQPELNGLQREFLPKPLSDEEMAILKKYRNGLTLSEFIKLSYNEKERFLDVYPAMGRPITDEMFNALPYELKNKYIGMSIGLSDEQYKSIQSDKNLLKRYSQITEKKLELYQIDLVRSEIDILRKYGILNKHINRLSGKNVWEFLSHSQFQDRQKTIDTLFDNNVSLTDRNVHNLISFSPNKQTTIDTLLNKNIPLTDHNVNKLLFFSQNRQQMIDTLFDKNVPLTDGNVDNLMSFSPNKQTTIDTLFDKNVPLTDDNVKSLLNYSPNVQKTIDILLRKNVPLTDSNLDRLVRYSKNKKQTLDILLNRDIQLTRRNVMFLSKYSKLFDYLSNKNVPLTDDTVLTLLNDSPKKQQMIDFLLNKGLSIDKILTGDKVGRLLYRSPNRGKLIALFLRNNIPLTDRNIENLLSYTISLRTREKLIDFLFEKNIALTEDNVENLLMYSPDKQKTIDTLLNKNVPSTDKNVGLLLKYSTDRQKTIDTLLNKNIPLTDHNVNKLLFFSRNRQQMIDFLLNKNIPLTENNVENLLKYSTNRQQMIDFLLNKNIPLTNRNVNKLLFYSRNRKQMIDTLLNKNVPLTDDTVYHLLRYLPNTSPRRELKQRIDALKLKQQLGETKFKYREFY